MLWSFPDIGSFKQSGERRIVMEEKTKKVLKETVKIGVAVGVGILAYKLYENYKDNCCDGDNYGGMSNIPTDDEYASICSQYD